MDCPKCGYAMGPFDEDCPRCKRITWCARCEARGVYVQASPASPDRLCAECQADEERAEIGRQLAARRDAPDATPGNQITDPVPAQKSPIPGAIALVLILACALVAWHATRPRPGYSIETLRSLSESGPTLIDYQLIHDGMTLAEVETILGPGTLASGLSLPGAGTSEIYQWDGSGEIGANMTVTLQDGRVVGKSQAGLQ